MRKSLKKFFFSKFFGATVLLMLSAMAIDIFLPSTSTTFKILSSITLASVLFLGIEKLIKSIRDSIEAGVELEKHL